MRDLLIHFIKAYSKVNPLDYVNDLVFFSSKFKGGIVMGYGYGENCGGFGGGFALLVVLFILLIIVGAACFGGGYGSGY